ncbi:fructosamine kinase family protein [Accumulibacter sp.]|uniref:fructosamine kinase family protein n=1 Tax=Accumulibacter sp. TaxID=2053492 RepID=UPI002611C0ED|nr:fructosamine kinase family protein [Accumulibacter sp.]
MSLAPALNPALASALRELIASDAADDSGPAADIDTVTEIGGGSISRALLVGAGKRLWFVKVNDADLAEMFAAEADGLQALAGCSALRVPRVVGHGVRGRQAYLVLEYLRLHPLREPRDAAVAGRALAELHRVRGTQYGWQRDNYIGSTPQDNTWHQSWSAFFSRRRLLPQLTLAGRHGDHASLIGGGERLLEKLDLLFAGYRPTASLLHGDLWYGNAATDESGRLALFDPAVHFGDREADLAMTELFGGFPDRFYAAYRESWPLADGFALRKTLYQLYHVLNHLNLFGSGYRRQAEAMIATLLAALGG